MLREEKDLEMELTTIEKVWRGLARFAPSTRPSLPAQQRNGSTSQLHKHGFTLLEVLVASVLMGMLVTILTMIFNQSAIAWRTGKASVADMSETERNLARIHSMADNVLPYTGSENYCGVPPWDDANDDSTTRFNSRGIRRAKELRTGVATVTGNYYNQDAGKGDWKKSGLGNPDLNGGKTFIVGVRSAGPCATRPG